MEKNRDGELSIFAGNGEVNVLLDGLDWENSPLGLPDSWPAELRVMVRQVLSSQFPMWIAWGPSLHLIYNDAYRAILGAKHPQALAMPVREVWFEILEQIEPLFAQTMDGTPTPILSAQFDIHRGKEIERVWFNFALTPAWSESGKVGGIFCVITENTTQVQAQHSMHQLHRVLEEKAVQSAKERDRLWQLSTDIMLIADFTAQIIAVNPAWSFILGRSEIDSVGLDFMQFVHPEDRAETLHEVSKLALGIKTLRFENRYLHTDGTYRDISWAAVPGGDVLHAVGRDVTEEKKVTVALLKSESALLQSQKMEAIGKLTGGVAHDFNNVLQIISGNLQLLEMSIGGNSDIRKRLESSTAAVGRGAKLAAQMLAFARKQPLQPLVTDVGRLLRSMDELLRRAVGEMVDVEAIVSGGLWHTLVDPHQLENVLLNLAINARDAMQGHGKLTIELCNSALDDAYAADYLDVTPGQYLLLAVTDTGAGISTEIIERIFDPFFTTKKEGEGTGLGLSMAYGFVKQSGGHIKVYSETGQGTTFKIYLPRSFEAVTDPPVTLTGPLLGGSETILVVEDDLHVQATVVDLLRQLGYSVLKANDGQSAMAIVNSGVPIDLMFTDVVMPGNLRSPDLARQAKALLPNLAVLFTSGYTQNAIVHGGRLDPGIELLSKPYRQQDLARKIRHLLANHDQTATFNSFRTELSIEPDASSSTAVGRHILLVEDNSDTRMITSELLVLSGHKVYAAGSAEDAIVLLDGTGIEVLLADITLPKMSGISLAGYAKKKYPGLAVIYSSGYAPDESGVNDRNAKYLMKPYTIEQLHAALETIPNTNEFVTE